MKMNYLWAIRCFVALATLICGAPISGAASEGSKPSQQKPIVVLVPSGIKLTNDCNLSEENKKFLAETFHSLLWSELNKYDEYSLVPVAELKTLPKRKDHFPSSDGPAETVDEVETTKMYGAPIIVKGDLWISLGERTGETRQRSVFMVGDDLWRGKYAFHGSSIRWLPKTVDFIGDLDCEVQTTESATQSNRIDGESTAPYLHDVLMRESAQCLKHLAELTAQSIQKSLHARVQTSAPVGIATAITVGTQSNSPIADKWALIIGISKFKNSKYNLRFASKDALDFYNFLVNEANFKRDHVLLLLDDKATAENIKTAFGDKFLPAVAQPGDMVVVFVSTHGTPKSKDHGGRNYIVAYDTDVDRLYATGVDMDELYRRTKEAVKTDRALIVMDTCYSGAGVPGAKAMNDGANFDAKEIAQGSGHLVITSSAPNERSWESKMSPNGVFTKYLIESLRQKNKKVDVKSAFLETQSKVSWEVKSAFSTSQTPQLGGEWEGKELILSVPASKPRQIFNPQILQMMQLQPNNSKPVHSAPSVQPKIRKTR